MSSHTKRRGFCKERMKRQVVVHGRDKPPVDE